MWFFRAVYKGELCYWPLWAVVLISIAHINVRPSSGATHRLVLVDCANRSTGSSQPNVGPRLSCLPAVGTVARTSIIVRCGDWTWRERTRTHEIRELNAEAVWISLSNVDEQISQKFSIIKQKACRKLKTVMWFMSRAPQNLHIMRVLFWRCGASSVTIRVFS